MIRAPLLVKTMEFTRWAMDDVDLVGLLQSHLSDELEDIGECVVSPTLLWSFCHEIPVGLVSGPSEIIDFMGADGYVPTSECLLCYG